MCKQNHGLLRSLRIMSNLQTFILIQWHKFPALYPLSLLLKDLSVSSL